MRLISFNVNGIRSMKQKLRNGEKTTDEEKESVILELIREQDPDILCFQEVKTQNKDDLAWIPIPYVYSTFSKEKKGYSGTVLFSKEEPEWVNYDFALLFEAPPHDHGCDEKELEEIVEEVKMSPFLQEGRMITAKFPNYMVVTMYTPNAKPKLARIKERIAWENLLRFYLVFLEQRFKIGVIVCGDLNCAHEDIDIHNPKANRKSPGFSDQERALFQTLLNTGYTDSFRHLYPERVAYSYWSNFGKSREKNHGWRIDYVLVSRVLRDRLVDALYLKDYYGSDHCPVLVELDM